jgi:hypothetical protein
MARDFKSSVIFPTQTGSVTAFGVAATNPTGVFRNGLNTLSIASNSSGSSAAFTASTSDFFFVDEQIADQLVVNSVSDGTKGEGLSLAAAPLGFRNANAPTSVSTSTGLWTYTLGNSTPLVNGQLILFTALTGGGGAFLTNRLYSVIVVSPNTFYLTERQSTQVIVPSANVTASTFYTTAANGGLGPQSPLGNGNFPEPLPGMYVRPMYLKVNVVPTNVNFSAITGAVSLQNITVTCTGSYVRGFSASTGAMSDLDSTPYSTVTSKTFTQVFADGVTPALGRGLIGTMPIQTDYPFLRFSISVGRTETSTTGLFGTGGSLGLGLSLVTGRDNAQP